MTQKHLLVANRILNAAILPVTIKKFRPLDVSNSLQA